MHDTDIHDIQSRLESAIKRTLDTLPVRQLKEQSIQRATINLSGIDPLEWLNAQPFHSRLFWSRRDNPEKIAGAGAVHHIITDSAQVMQSIRNYLAGADAAIRYYGGMRFDTNRDIAIEWLPYAKFRFMVPRFELITSGDSQTLSINFFMSPKIELPALFVDLKKEISKLAPPLPIVENGLPEILERIEVPSHSQWLEMMQKAMGAIEREEFEKIVLAGKTILSFSREINPYLLLRQILKKNGRTFHFGFQFEHGVNFIGMSPECLFQRQGDVVRTEAIAATRPRGSTPAEDDALGRELAESDKDLREHRWVKKMILDRLSSYCKQIDETSTEKLLKLSHVQHLVSEFHAELRPGVENERILSALHPTPAVGGYPKKGAVEQIALLEPFDRGWYAAPVGWVSQETAEFAVAIRSALVQKTRLHIFAGSGIVKGSDPQKEWDENRNKAQNFLQLFESA